MPKGKKYGGRQKGTPNKATAEMRRRLAELCPDGSDPLTFFSQVLKDKSAPYEVRERAARELLPFTHPKLSSVEPRIGGKTHEQRLQELQAMASEDDDACGDCKAPGDHC